MFFWKRKKDVSSSCTTWKSRAKEFLPLLAGLILTLSGILLAKQRIASVEREIYQKAAPVEIVVPSIAIPAGGVFGEQNLAKKSVPATGISPRNVPASEFELLLGARAKGNLVAGEPILWIDVEEPVEADKFSRTIPAGRRAFTLGADPTASFAGLIRTGDRVDLLCEGGKGTTNQTWIRNIPVISVDRNFTRPPTGDDAHEVSNITVSVTPEEGSHLASVSREGRIHWFLMNPEERPPSGRLYANWRKAIRDKVEIWEAGKMVLPSPVRIGDLE